MKKQILAGLIVGMMVATPVWGAKNKVVKIGERPESLTKGFGGKYYVTVMNSPDKEGDAVIKVLDGEKSKVFAKGLNEPKGIAFTGKYLVTADQTRVMKIDRKGNVSVLADKNDFPREVSFLNDVAASHDRKSVYVTDMGAISKMFDPDKERTLWPIGSKQDKELPRKGCVYKVTLEGKVTLAVPAGNKLMRFPNGVTVTGKKDEEILVMGDFFTGNIVAYNNEKFRVLAKGMRGADAVEFGKGVIYVSSWPLGKVWKYDRKSKKTTVLSDKFTTAADFFYDP